MEAELGEGNMKPEVLPKLAQYELTLLDWVEAHRGYRKYVAIAGKCWPAFQTQFGFVPCYVNSRLTGMGIPVSCEVDIYGALSEFIGTAVSNDIVTLLDINNTVPDDMFDEAIKGKYDYTHKDTFMGFHCGNTNSKKLSACSMKNQMIMARSLPVEVTNGTLEGDIVPGEITFYVCSPRQTISCAHISLTARFCRLRPSPSEESAYSQSPRWEDSIAMCSLRATILITVPLRSDTLEKRSMKCLSISAWSWTRSDSISLRACSTNPRILLHKQGIEYSVTDQADEISHPPVVISSITRQSRIPSSEKVDKKHKRFLLFS